MIAVIADDFTGAAEIGGVGLKYGLKVVIETKVNRTTDADLLVIAAATRSLSEKDAFNEIENITQQLKTHKPLYIYKKLDSVLRGHIVAEIIAQLNTSGKNRAIIVAGNPEIGRTIINGTYLINGVPLAETSFAKDPDFQVNSSKVTEIVCSDEVKVSSFSAGADIPKSGIIIGDVSDQDEMERWAQRIDRQSVIAGGAGFFDVLMSRKYTEKQANFKGCLGLGDHTLFIFGSKYPKAELLPMSLKQEKTVQLNMPDEIYANSNFNSSELTNWANQIIENLSRKLNVIITVEQDFSKEENLSERIRKNIGEVVKLVSDNINLTDLLIEGGATTSEILKAMGINKLFPNRLVRPGIIQMRVKEFPNLTLTTKPGSYPWPSDVILSENCSELKD